MQTTKINQHNIHICCLHITCLKSQFAVSFIVSNVELYLLRIICINKNSKDLSLQLFWALIIKLCNKVLIDIFKQSFRWRHSDFTSVICKLPSVHAVHTGLKVSLLQCCFNCQKSLYLDVSNDEWFLLIINQLASVTCLPLGWAVPNFI